MRMARMTPLLCMVMFMACAAEEPPPSPDPAPVELPAASVAISADWQNGSLSFLDADALLAPGGTFEDALIERMPLAAPGEQGPLTVVTTGDGTRAIVLRSNGVMAFVGARIGIDAGNSPSSRLASLAPHRSRCDAALSPRAASPRAVTAGHSPVQRARVIVLRVRGSSG